MYCVVEVNIITVYIPGALLDPAYSSTDAVTISVTC